MALCAVPCDIAVLFSLSLCSHALNFRLCWLFSLSGVFSLGLVPLVRLCAVFEPLTVCAWFGVPSVMGDS